MKSYERSAPWERMDRRAWAVWVARLGGIGGVSVAPATVATLAAGVPCALLLGYVKGGAAYGIVLMIVALSCYAADVAETVLKRSDPQEVVVDELAGYLVAMVGFPATALSLFVGFVAFRVFDIWKPWPLHLLHTRLKGGVAIVADDVGAGIYAHLLVWLALKIWG